MFKSKKTAWLTIAALLVPTTIGLFGSSAAQADTVTDLSLSSLLVNGEEHVSDNTINLDVSVLNSTSTTTTVDGVDSTTTVLSVPVEAVATDATNTMVQVSGNSNLHLGANTLTVTVTDTAAGSAQDPMVYTKTLFVQNNDTSAVIVVNQEELTNGDYTETDWGTTSVPVVVTPTDPNATVMVNGSVVALVAGVARTTASGLVTGENDVVVKVTAVNGEYDESTITVVVDKNTDTTITSITVDGIIASDGDTVPLDWGTTDPDIEIVTADEDATYVIDGGSDLITGENHVSIYVYAADGVTTQTYDLTLVVANNNDTTATITVNGTARADGDEVVLAYGTTSVNVSVDLADADASYVVEGDGGLVQGSNDLLVTVTAADNLTTQLYAITLTVSDPDVTLQSISFNGNALALDGTGTAVSTSLVNTFVVVPTDSRSTISVDGGIYNAQAGTITLVAGQNDVTITVTGDDKATTADYVLSLGVYNFNVSWDGNSDGETVVASGTVQVPGIIESVTVDPVVPFDGWSATVEGNTDLAFGDNTVYVTMTSGDNSQVITASFTVFVGAVDLTFDTLTVGGEDVTLTGLTGTVSLDNHPASAEVEAVPIDPRSTVVVTGGDNLVTGSNNTVTVVVTGADNSTATYVITVNVLPSEDSDITSFSVNGDTVDPDADITEVDAGELVFNVDTADGYATSVVTVTPTNSNDGSWVTSSNGVFTGSGFLTVSVVVTAENGVAAAPVEYHLIASKDFVVTSGSNPVTDILRVGTYATSTYSTVSSWFPAGTKLSYKWLNAGEVISGATTSRLLMTPDYLAANDGSVRPVVYATVGGVVRTYFGQPLDVSLGLIALASTPGVTGKAQIGNTLTVVPKKWTADVEKAYQWYVNGAAFDGATSETFALSLDNVRAGDVVYATVTGSLDGYESLTKTSASFTVLPGVLKITEKPELSVEGGYVTDGVITVSEGATNYDNPTAFDMATRDYQWYRNGVAIYGANEAQYTIVAADVAKKLSVVVSFSADSYSSTTITLKAPSIKLGMLEDQDVASFGLNEAGTKVIAYGGYATTVATKSVKYIWYRNGKVVLGQTTNQYTLSAKDSGASIAVQVTATYVGYKTTVTKTTGDDNYQG